MSVVHTIKYLCSRCSQRNGCHVNRLHYITCIIISMYLCSGCGLMNGCGRPGIGSERSWKGSFVTDTFLHCRHSTVLSISPSKTSEIMLRFAASEEGERIYINIVDMQQI